MVSARIVSGFCVALTAALAAYVVPTLGQGPDEQLSRLGLKRKSILVQQGRYREAAAIDGEVRLRLPKPEFSVSGLDGVARHSDVVLIADVLSPGHTQLSQTPAVVSQYTFSVEAVLKGHQILRGRKQVAITVPGGRVVFDGGSFVDVAPTFTLPLKGERYVVFLRRASTDQPGAPPDALVPAFSNWSLYELSPSGTVHPHSVDTGPAKTFAGARTDLFLDEVREAIKRLE